MESGNKTAVFAGGCFWCTEAVFARLKGVKSVTPGYTGGHVENPTYEQVSRGDSGHAEAVRFEYDPDQVTFNDLLHVFFATHNPTELNRQGADVGPQYRSAVFYADKEQKDEAESFIRQLEEDGVYEEPIVTQVEPLGKFYEAEDYHKNYYENNKDKNPYCEAVINPKLKKLKERFAELTEA